MGSLAIRDKIARELTNRETLPGSPKNEKLFPNGLFGNNVICSPLTDHTPKDSHHETSEEGR